MLRYSATRLLQGLISIFAVVTIVFFLARLGGDPAALLAGPTATPEQIAQLRTNLGLDQPIPVQYVNYLWGVLHGDLGQSSTFSKPVLELVIPAVLNSAKLVLTSFVIALVLGVTLGTVAAVRRNSIADKGVRMIAVAGQSMPSFWLGLLLVLLFSVQLQWLPAFGMDTYSAWILPALALAGFTLAAMARLTRSAVIDVYGRDQTLFLRAKGVSPVVLMSHVLRNASLPIITLAGVQLGAMFSGTVVVETVFAWPGVGLMSIQAIQDKDFAVIQGIVVINTVVFVGLLFAVDLAYGLLDPRIRHSDAAAKVAAP